MRSARLSRCVVLKSVPRRDAAQRLSLAFGLLVREGRGVAALMAEPGDAGLAQAKRRAELAPRAEGARP
jgi:hypothetical protein